MHTLLNKNISLIKQFWFTILINCLELAVKSCKWLMVGDNYAYLPFNQRTDYSWVIISRDLKQLMVCTWLTIFLAEFLLLKHGARFCWNQTAYKWQNYYKLDSIVLWKKGSNELENVASCLICSAGASALCLFSQQFSWCCCICTLVTQ